MKRGEESPSENRSRPLVSKIEMERDVQALRAASIQLLGGLASAISFLILFAWLSGEVFEGELQQLDSSVRAMVHAFSSPQMTRVMQALTFLGSLEFLSALFVLFVILFLAQGMRRAAMWFAVAAGGSEILDAVLKLAFHRSRPVPFFGAAPPSYSFPSGHAMSSFCFYGVLAGLYSARIRSRAARILAWIVSAALIAGIGLSRIYLGVHYPTDVVAGYLAGAVWVSTLLFVDRLGARKSKTS